MLGSGRPFLVEVQKARRIPSEAFVREIETNINNLENKLVSSMPIVSTLLPHIKKHDYDRWCIKHFEMQVGASMYYNATGHLNH